MNGDPAKSILREEMLRWRRGLDPGRRRMWSDAIEKRVIESQCWQEAGRILAYASMPDEVRTDGLIEGALAQDKELALPRCRPAGGCFDAVAVSGGLNDLVPGAFPSLREPPEDWPIKGGPGEFDLILIPGVAFDRRGNRLGFGAGMYDRFLGGGGRAVRLALAFDCQLVDAVPSTSTDQPVDIVVTENEWIPAGRNMPA